MIMWPPPALFKIASILFRTHMELASTVWIKIMKLAALHHPTAVQDFLSTSSSPYVESSKIYSHNLVSVWLLCVTSNIDSFMGWRRGLGEEHFEFGLFWTVAMRKQQERACTLFYFHKTYFISACARPCSIPRTPQSGVVYSPLQNFHFSTFCADHI